MIFWSELCIDAVNLCRKIDSHTIIVLLFVIISIPYNASPSELDSSSSRSVKSASLLVELSSTRSIACSVVKLQAAIVYNTNYKVYAWQLRKGALSAIYAALVCTLTFMHPV